MSRNVRQKYSSTFTRAPRRRPSDSSQLNLSDDDGYSAVDGISDSEDDDEDDVNAVEEENIVMEASAKSSARPQPNAHDPPNTAVPEPDRDEQLVDNSLSAAHNNWINNMSEFEGQYALVTSQDSDLAAMHPPADERHVHFNVPSSDSDSTESEEDHADLFPDIFVSQTSLDPAFRRELEHDPDESSGSGSFWDFHGQADDPLQDSDADDALPGLWEGTEQDLPRPHARPVPAPTEDPSPQEDAHSKGYETDGDTTEDDEPEPLFRARSRRLSNMSDQSSSDSQPPIRPQRGQPRIGRYNLDRSDKKPIAVLNPLTRKMMIFTPHRRRQLDLSPEQFNIPWAMEEQSSPLLSNSANLMLSAMFAPSSLGDYSNAHAIGPAEAFFPANRDPATDASSTTPSVQGDEEDGENQLDISDFITWGDDPSSGDDEDDGAGGWEPTSTRSKTAAAVPGESDILSHLNPDLVGAFRRNQINQQLILSNQATQDSLAFSGPYNFTALRGLRSDRFETASVPLTPIRRQRKPLAAMTSSPLASVLAKRKATDELASSRRNTRHKGLSDASLLHV